MEHGLMESPVAKKKPVKSEQAEPTEPKRYGSMIRVGDDFAEAVRKVCALSKRSAADYTAERLLPIVLDDYDKLLAAESKASKNRRK